MTHDALLSRVAARTGLAAPGEAERSTRAVLGVLATCVPFKLRQALAEDLPAPLAPELQGEAAPEPLAADAFFQRVAERTGARLGVALEHTGVVLGVLAEALSEGTVHRLHEALPEELSWRLTPLAPEAPSPPVHVPVGRRSTLSEGRPGSSHPLSEARPERAHSHSVVREDNPHGDTKLSTATGLTQEREGETLATGRPR